MAPSEDGDYLPEIDDEYEADGLDDEDPSTTVMSALLISERGENMADVLTRLEARVDAHLTALNKNLADIAKALKQKR
jgi:hypothetical protein